MFGDQQVVVVLESFGQLAGVGLEFFDADDLNRVVLLLGCIIMLAFLVLIFKACYSLD